MFYPQGNFYSQGNLGYPQGSFGYPQGGFGYPQGGFGSPQGGFGHQAFGQQGFQAVPSATPFANTLHGYPQLTPNFAPQQQAALQLQALLQLLAPQLAAQSLTLQHPAGMGGIAGIGGNKEGINATANGIGQPVGGWQQSQAYPEQINPARASMQRTSVLGDRTLGCAVPVSPSYPASQEAAMPLGTGVRWPLPTSSGSQRCCSRITPCYKASISGRAQISESRSFATFFARRQYRMRRSTGAGSVRAFRIFSRSRAFCRRARSSMAAELPQAPAWAPCTRLSQRGRSTLAIR